MGGSDRGDPVGSPHSHVTGGYCPGLLPGVIQGLTLLHEPYTPKTQPAAGTPGVTTVITMAAVLHGCDLPLGTGLGKPMQTQL